MKLYRSPGFEVLGILPEGFRHPAHGCIGLRIMHCPDKPLVADLPDHSGLSPRSASMNDYKGPPVDLDRPFHAFARRLL